MPFYGNRFNSHSDKEINELNRKETRTTFTSTLDTAASLLCSQMSLLDCSSFDCQNRRKNKGIQVDEVSCQPQIINGAQ